mmetsp:Transcript_22609/g.33192  ORF Transcript_22609/g.33192 Transcript_22609/m.33192 type:complete len:777 (-) Transcript_22609:627-2957(-)
MFVSKRWCFRQHLFFIVISLFLHHTSTAFVPFAPIFLHNQHSSSSIISPTTTTTTMSSSNGDLEGDDTTTTENKKASTGWNHNMPSESSTFWKPLKDDDGNTYNPPSVPSSPPSGDKDTKEEPRTGWLHNTAPKSSAPTSPSSKPRELAAVKMLRLEKYKRRRNHRIISPPALHPCGNNRRAVVTEHLISVPIHRTSSKKQFTYGNLPSTTTKEEEEEGGDRMDIYFTITELIQNESDEDFFTKTLSSLSDLTMQDCAELYVQRCNMKNANDMILYLQGGPGFGCAAPMSGIGLSDKSSWAAEALSHGFKRVVLMDQRGTGRSTPITKQTLQRRFPDLFALDGHVATAEVTSKFATAAGDDSEVTSTIAEQLDEWSEIQPDVTARVGVSLGHAVEYMSNFRADNIVKDAEAVKDTLLLSASSLSLSLNDDAEEEVTPKPWGAALGQSFGGFCMMSYLSLIPHPPKICLLTGGIAPMLTPVYDAYDSLWDRVKERNFRYYDQYPGDITLVKRIVRRLLSENNPVVLPSGGILTARRFLQLGISLGGSPSAFASFHSLLASAIVSDGVSSSIVNEEDDEDIEFTRAFLKHVDSEQPFDDAPIYFLMHESIYADGPNSHSTPTDWAAHRVFTDRTKTPNEFSFGLTSKLNSDARPTLFFGEMVFPWMADGDFSEVSGFGMKALAHSLASKDDWEPLYDADSMRRALANGGPCKAAAAVYYDDMYVDFDACMKVTARGGPLEKCKVWITNDYQHSGLRDNGAEIFTKILGMAKGTIRTPS